MHCNTSWKVHSTEMKTIGNKNWSKSTCIFFNDVCGTECFLVFCPWHQRHLGDSQNEVWENCLYYGNVLQIRVMNDRCNVPFFYHHPWSWCLIKWSLKGRILILKACVLKYYWNQPCTVSKTIVCCSQWIHRQGQLSVNSQTRSIAWWFQAKVMRNCYRFNNESLSVCLSVSLSHFHPLALSFSQSHHSLSRMLLLLFLFLLFPPKHTFELMHSFAYVWNPCVCVVSTESVPHRWRQDIKKRPCVCFTTLVK